MIPFFRRILSALFYDEAAFERWAVGALGFLVMLASQVFIDGVDAAFAWNKRQWIAKIATALLGLFLTMIPPKVSTSSEKAELQR